MTLFLSSRVVRRSRNCEWCKEIFGHRRSSTYLCLLLQVESIDFFQFSFLGAVSDSTSISHILYHTTRKKNVALFACKDVCGSSVSWLIPPCGGMIGVAPSFLMSYNRVSAIAREANVTSSRTFLSAL